MLNTDPVDMESLIRNINFGDNTTNSGSKYLSRMLANVNGLGHIAQPGAVSLNQATLSKDPQVLAQLAQQLQKNNYNFDLGTLKGRIGRGIFGGINTDGSKKLGAIDILPLLQSGFGLYSGFKQLGMAEDQLNMENDKYNFNKNQQLMNLAEQSNLNDLRHAESVGSNYDYEQGKAKKLQELKKQLG